MEENKINVLTFTSRASRCFTRVSGPGLEEIETEGETESDSQDKMIRLLVERLIAKY